MKIIHLADSHLGFSSYSRLDEHGQNRIDEMVYSGFDKAIDQIIKEMSSITSGPRSSPCSSSKEACTG